jgi:uncharacterized protein YlxW (UPF0749 family)
MTSTLQRGGGPRSMGASLLDQVLAETLDPAYAQAAARKVAAAKSSAVPTESDPAAGTARTDRRRARVLVVLVMVIAGLLAAITYDQAAAGAQGRAQVREALLGDIHRETATAEGLTGQLDRLRRQVNRTRDQALRATAVGQQALDSLSSAEQGAAALAVRGPGLLVTLANAEPDADSDPVGGTTEPDPVSMVRDSDLQLVVNALWAAGAEAISIDGQRLGPTSAIRFAGEAVLVDFNPVTNPYEVRVIGDPDTLSRHFIDDPQVGALAGFYESYGMRFDFAKEKDLSLPAASLPELRSAAAVPRGAPTPDQEPGD